MTAYSPDTTEWNRQAAEFLNLSPCDQELYIAAVNAGGDPSILLEVLPNEGFLVAIAASGADISIVLAALPPEVFDLAAESAVSWFTGF